MGLVFWPWAIYNTLVLRDKSQSTHMGLDFGSITFIFLLFAAIFGLTSIDHSHMSIAAKYATAHLILTPIGHIAVTINYIAGAILAPTHVYMVYCVIFAVIFAVTGIIFTKLAQNWRNSFDSHLKIHLPLDMSGVSIN